MATLNIKNFPAALHRKLAKRAKREHRSVAQEVVHLLEASLEASELLSVLSLRGLGKEAWKGVDAARHIARERESWK